ncbi:MAG: endonuclease/exonuclease/phosphatase family protein [Leptolyngbyaceae cyanobacterium RM1_406_9]|nr:endonuclease/exonuclease/phosphatase family protein [Leptolyngbyaceae cyanobacterium RM1_406_9]
MRPVVAQPAETLIRFASFNTFLNREAEGQLITDLSTLDNSQAQAVAEIIQRVNPDVLLLKEFDFDAEGRAVWLFQRNYLEVSQNGATPVEYPYVYLSSVNTGIASGFDLDNDGTVDSTPGDRTYGGDAFGFGVFPGQYAMVLLSRYPIVEEEIRTFQTFLWRDMPDALLPDDLETPEPNDWYSPDELAVVRLSSKNHWDVPVDVDGVTIHILASHPTPPVFDGPEDRNGRRNFDELRLWADYITSSGAGYLYDDAGERGGLEVGERFVIMGDLNADPFDGDGMPGAIAQLLEHPLVNASVVPASEGAAEDGDGDDHEGPPQFDTAAFGDFGNFRLDYVLPSVNLEVVEAGIFWPTQADLLFGLVGDGNAVVSSDHRLVWVDLKVRDEP